MIGMIKYQCNGWRNESAKSKFVKNNYVVLLTCTCKINDDCQNPHNLLLKII